MHDAVVVYIAEVIDDLGLGGDILDIGGRNVNGTTRSLFRGAGRYITVDIQPHPSVDIVADAGDLDLGETFDVVVSTECLEHTPRGADIVASAYRHLRQGGVFVATMAGPGRAPHGASGEYLPPDGEWYRNVTREELNGWLTDAGFGKRSIDVLGEDVRCWGIRMEG